MVAWIGVEEIGVERSHHVVGQAEPEHVAIERHGIVDVLDVQYGVTHAERSGAEARDRAAGLERIARGLGAMEDFKPVAQRIGKHDKVLDAALIRKREPRATSTPACSSRAAKPSSAAASATSQPKNATPSPPSSLTSTRCLRSSIRSARLLPLRSTSCIPKNWVPKLFQSSSDFA